MVNTQIDINRSLFILLHSKDDCLYSTVLPLKCHFNLTTIIVIVTVIVTVTVIVIVIVIVTTDIREESVVGIILHSLP
jgi:hypothetical protein